MRRQTIAMAKELGVVGLMNVQFAVKGNDIYVLEVNHVHHVLFHSYRNVLVNL
ncbi:hypothetical protein ABVN80_11685 [Acinetobacter baumannii]